MNHINNPPVIASASSSFSLDFGAPSDPSLPSVASFNINNDDTLDAQTHENRRIAPLPIRRVASTSSTSLKAQDDQNLRTAPLPLRQKASTSSKDPSASLRPQPNENMLPPPLPTTNMRGKKRKSTPANDKATASEPKKSRKTRPLSERQQQKQKAPEVISDDQVSSASLRHDSDSEHNNQNSAYGMNQDVITNGVQRLPYPFPNHMLPDQFAAIQQQPRGVVNDAQHLQYLVSTCGLPGIVPVDVNEQYPARILQLMVAVRDPGCDRVLGAYFVPYLWFPEDPKRPYRLQKDDRYFWGQRIYEYHHRVKCGRIAYTITCSPVLFVKSEEKKTIDSINYHTLVNSHRQKTGNIQDQDQGRQFVPGISVDQGFGASSPVAASSVTSSQVDALPTDEQPASNVLDNGSEYTATLTEAASQEYQPSMLPLMNVVNSFTDSQLNNDNLNETDTNTSISFDYNYNTPIIQPGPSIDIPQLFPPVASNTFPEFQFTSNINTDMLSNFTFDLNDLPIIEEPLSTDIGASNINTDAMSPFIFDINDLPVIDDIPTNEFLQSLGNLSASPSLDTQFNSNNYSASDINPNMLSSFTLDSTVHSGPSNHVTQSFSELEDMYTNINWFASEEAQPSTSKQ